MEHDEMLHRWPVLAGGKKTPRILHFKLNFSKRGFWSSWSVDYKHFNNLEESWILQNSDFVNILPYTDVT